jgi:hypothetical protein
MQQSQVAKSNGHRTNLSHFDRVLQRQTSFDLALAHGGAGR